MYHVNPKYLRLHGNKWHLKIRLTKEIQELHEFKGKTHWVKSLSTDSLTVALQRRDQYLAWLYDLQHGIELVHAEQTTLPTSRTVMVDSPSTQSSKPLATLNEAYEKTLTIKQGMIKDNELQRYRVSFSSFINYLKVKQPTLQSLKRQQATGFIQHLREQQRTDKTIHGHLNRLSVIFKTALAYDLVDAKNPFTGHNISPKPTTRRSFYYPEQVKQIYQALPDEAKLPWKVCYFTGLRASELFELTQHSLKEVESASGKVLCLQIAVNGGKTENAKRLVPVHNALKAELADFTGFAITKLNFKDKRRQAVISSYGQDFAATHDTHSLRHTFITTLVDALGNTELVEWLVGHSRTHRRSTTYQNYFHGFGLDKLNNAVQLMPDIFS